MSAAVKPIRLQVFDPQGNPVETVDIDPVLFGGRVRKALLKQVILSYEANRRRGTHDTKERGELSFSRKKPWAQKHTGRARAGKKNSPIWRKGGTVFGPTPRSYRQFPNARMRNGAFQSAILAKLLDDEVRLVSDLEFKAPKTSEAAKVLGNLKIGRGCLVGTPASDPNVWKSFRNIPRVTVEPVGQWNALSVVRHRNLLLSKRSFAELLALQESREGRGGSGGKGAARA